MSSGGVYAKGVAKHAQILEAAVRVFDREGGSGTTMRAVAAESGLSLAGLMHYFPSRDQLLTEMLASIDREGEAIYRERGDSVSPGDLLAEFMQTNADNPVRIRIYVAMVAAAAGDADHPAVPFFRERYALFRSVVGDHVREQQARGEVPASVDPDFAALSLIAAADGVQNQWLHDPTIDMAEHMRRTWRNLMT